MLLVKYKSSALKPPKQMLDEREYSNTPDGVFLTEKKGEQVGNNKVESVFLR